MSRNFPSIDDDALRDTRDALHAYARLLGDCLKSSQSKRKHWWHASLRPSLTGLTTGVIHAEPDFQLEIDLRNSQLHLRTSAGDAHSEQLKGQPADQLLEVIGGFLASNGINSDLKSHINLDANGTRQFDDYSPEHANLIGRIFSDVAACMAEFRASIREETSPVQLWPHHFDLSMLWLPGSKIPGQDADDAESADQQMNFGFTLGDEGIPEPYFYVTAYPTPDGLPSVSLPEGARWQSSGFSGVVLKYQRLLEESDRSAYLLRLWNGLLGAGRASMLDGGD
jgi:hypothetical protein